MPGTRVPRDEDAAHPRLTRGHRGVGRPLSGGGPHCGIKATCEKKKAQFVPSFGEINKWLWREDKGVCVE